MVGLKTLEIRKSEIFGGTYVAPIYKKCPPQPWRYIIDRFFANS